MARKGEGIGIVEGWQGGLGGEDFLCGLVERVVQQVLLSLVKKYGSAACDQACAAALELGVSEYQFVRRYLERSPQAPLTRRQVDPLIRELTQYRDVIQQRIQFEETKP